MHRNKKRLLALSTLSVFLFSNVASAADHFILDGTTVDYILGIDGNDDLTIKQSGGNGITIADTSGDVTTDAALTSTGNFDVNGNFSVTAASGNTTVGGTLGVTGNTTLSTLDVTSTAGIDGNFDVNTTAFTVIAASGNTTAGGTLTSTGNFDVNTTAFTVIAASGNTTVGGTLDVTGDLDVNSNFTVTAASGNTDIGGTLDVTGALTAASIDLGSTTVVSSILDDDAFTADSATALATQQSIKAYVDGAVGAIDPNTLDEAYDQGGAGAGRTITVDTGAVVLDGSNAADETLEVSRITATTNSVIDVMVVEAESAGTPASNLGAGLVFNVEDAGGIEEQGSIDLVVTTVSDTTEESRFVFSVQDAGVIGARLTVAGEGVTLTSGATVDTIQTTITDLDTAIPTSGAVIDYLTANDSDTTYTAGDGLALDGTEFNADVDDATIELSATDGSGVLRVKDGGIDADAIGTNAVTADELADDAVDTDAIVDANVTLAKLASNSVDASKIANDSILFEDFAAATVLTAADDDLTTADDLDGGSATVIPSTDAVVAYVSTYVAGEIDASSLFEPGDTGTESVQANNGNADANGDYSLAIGDATTNGNYTFAYGDGATATGAYSLAGGFNITATGDGSVAIGVDGNALSYGEVVLGLFSDNTGYTADSTTAHDVDDRLFVIGNGTGTGARANALVMLKTGNTTANGNWDFDGLSLAGGSTVTEISNDTTLADAAAAALVTENAVKTYVDTEIAGVTYTAGDGLTLTGQDFDVNVDDATLEIATDTLQVKDGGIDSDAIGTGAVGTDEIANNTVSIDDIGTGAVGSDEILNGEVAFIDLADALILTDAEDTGSNLGGGSATVIATTDAVKAYVDGEVAAIGNTLDESYDQGGAGAGRVITVDSGAVDLVGSNGSAPTLITRRSNSAQNAVQNVAFFEVTSSGGAGLNGIGAGLAFYIEDGSNTEEQASIDAVMVDVTNDAEESEINFSVQSAGAITEIATVDSGGFDVTGNITATGTITSSSDASLKTNVNPLKNALASVLQLTGVSFDWIGGEETETGSNIGVIAQNVQTVYPELVGENEAGLTVNYAGLVAPLIEAIKELKEEKDAEIEALQEQIAELQAQLSQ